MSGRESPSTHRTALGLLLAVSFLLYAIPVWWGLPAGGGGKTWAYDEVVVGKPNATAMQRHHGRYPPFHYQLLRGLAWPVRALDDSGALDLEPGELDALLQLIGRMLSVLMATATVYLVYRCARRLFDPATSWFAAAVTALITPLVYYAKTINLEAP